MDKKTFRKETLTKREILYSAEIDSRIVDRFYQSPLYKDSQWIMIYVSFGTEIKTHDLIKKMLSDGKNVVVPICEPATHTMILSQLRDFDEDLQAGHWGILEVKEDKIDRVSPETLDIVVMPGMAFTVKGERMGFGGGYYDRFLDTLPEKTQTVALIREDFIYDDIPTEPHDKSVDYVITENRTIHCSADKN